MRALCVVGQMTFDRFMVEVFARTKASNHLRLGQVFYNYLYDIKPNLALEIVGTDKDPFYVDTRHQPRFIKAFSFVRQHWDDFP